MSGCTIQSVSNLTSRQNGEQDGRSIAVPHPDASNHGDIRGNSSGNIPRLARPPRHIRSWSPATYRSGRSSGLPTMPDRSLPQPPRRTFAVIFRYTLRRRNHHKAHRNRRFSVIRWRSGFHNLAGTDRFRSVSETLVGDRTPVIGCNPCKTTQATKTKAGYRKVCAGSAG